MASDRQLLDYLPPFLQDVVDLRYIMKAEQPEFDNLWEQIENALKDQFIIIATEKGIKRWEQMLKISPKDTDTLEERRFRIITKINRELPYTERKLHETLTAICGEGNYEIDLQPQNYHITVKLALANQNNYREVVDLLKDMLPANLTQTVQVQYNPHGYFINITHSEMSAYTHTQLRNEVFTNG